MSLYTFTNDGTKLDKITPTSFCSENIREVDHIQEALATDISVLEDGLLVISREYNKWAGSQKAIDILALDLDGNLVVIELKRGCTDSAPDLQAIRYAGMLSVMSREDIILTLQEYREFNSVSEAEAVLREFFQGEVDEYNLGEKVRIYLVAQNFTDEVVATVLWLNSQGLDVSCYTLSPYRYQDVLLLHAQKLIPLREANEWQQKFTRKRMEVQETESKVQNWNGEYYASLWPAFEWELAYKYGFIAAGGGKWYSSTFLKLKKDVRVWVKWVQHGYVGVGSIESQPIPMGEFKVEFEGQEKLLSELSPFIAKLAENDGTEYAFYALKVNWEKKVTGNKAVSDLGLYGIRNVVCRPKSDRWLPTLAALKKQWGMAE